MACHQSAWNDSICVRVPQLAQAGVNKWSVQVELKKANRKVDTWVEHLLAAIKKSAAQNEEAKAELPGTYSYPDAQ